jgi:DNA-directed RNA polymerase specialized sigma24 family protein
MRIYLATWLFEPSQGKALTKARKRERLVSYYHTAEKKDQFQQYVETGRNDEIISSVSRPGK